MKKAFFLTLFLAAILFAGNQANAYVICWDTGSCFKCEDDEAAEHPDGGCVSAEQGCVAATTICYSS